MSQRYNRFTTNDLPFDTYSDSDINIVKDETDKTETEREKRHKERIKEKLENSSNSKQPDSKQNSNELENDKSNQNEEFLKKVEKASNDNLKYHRANSTRNKVIIITLIILLIIAITVVVIYASISKMQNNCSIYSHGDASVVFYVDGDDINEFRSPSAIQGNRIYNFDLDMKITSDGEYNVSFIIYVYENDELVSNTLAYDHNSTLFSRGSDGYYYSNCALSKSNGLIDLCNGVAIDENEDTLNVNNFKMEIHVYLEKV